MRSQSLRLKWFRAVSGIAAGMVMASTGLAALFAVIVTTVFDWSWNGVYVGTTSVTVNGQEFSEAASQTLLIALPLLVTILGVALLCLGWRACRSLSSPFTTAAHRS